MAAFFAGGAEEEVSRDGALRLGGMLKDCDMSGEMPEFDLSRQKAGLLLVLWRRYKCLDTADVQAPTSRMCDRRCEKYKSWKAGSVWDKTRRS